MEVEEQFGVAVTDDEAEKLRTPGDLYQLIKDKGAIGDVKTSCIPRRVFRKLAEALTQIETDRTTRLRPSTAMPQALGGCKPPQAWPELEKLTEWKMAPLRRPRRLTRTLIVSYCVITLGLFIYLVARLSAHGLDFLEAVMLIGFGTLTMGGGLAVLLELATRWARVASPAETLMQLSRQVMAKNSAKIFADHGSMWAERAGGKKIQKIVAEALGVEIDEVTADARFVQDLGMC